MPGLGGILVQVTPPNYYDPHNWSNATDPSNFLSEPTGTLARTVPRDLIGSGTLAGFTTTGTVLACGVALPAGVVITNLATISGNTAVSGQTHYWMGLADANLNVLAVTADQLASAVGANAQIKLALTAQFTVQVTALYYVLASSTASTTAPTATGASIATGVPGAAAGSPVLCGTAGIQTTPPAVGTQLNAGVVSSTGSANFCCWLS